MRKSSGERNTHTYHVNFLKRWESPSAICLHSAVTEDMDDLPSWEETPDTGEIIVNEQLTAAQTQEMRQLLADNQDMFSNTPGATTTTVITIDTGDARPICSPPYRLAHAQTPMVKKEMDQMLRAGIITTSKSPWASPLLMVAKKDGTLRPVIDYRKLNKITKPDPFPMPRIEDLIDDLASATYITTLDLTKGYWQVPVEETSRDKTAFVTPFGKYEFTVMPFGLMGAPATFQRMMNDIFGDASNHVAAYIDVIFSRNWEEHLLHVNDALTRIRQAGLTVKGKKCQMAMTECLFLGHIVGRGQVKPDSAKIAALREVRIPKRKDVRSFLGLAGYYRRFVENFSTIATPLSDLTKIDRPDKVIWEPQHQEAFETLIERLSTNPILQGPDYSKEFVLHTDASNVGIGAVLSQLNEDGEDRPVAYFSRKLLPREKNFAAVDKGCLAIVDGIRHFQVYLTGVKFEVVTDHQCLKYLDSVKDAGGRRTRWALRLQPFRFSVRHKAGKTNGNADGLSQQAWEEEDADLTTLQDGVGGVL